MVPLISIITITYNAENVISPTLKSLSKQTFRDYEHLVIDGASSDSTVHKIYRESPDSIVISEPDRGLYDAMNKGLKKAKGRYILFLNAGDSFHSVDSLQHYAEAIRLNRNADIIYGDTIIVNSDREYVSPRHFSVPEKLTFKSFAQGMLVCHQAFMVRKDLAPEYNTAYRFSADYEWTLRCLQKANPERNINLHTIVIDYLSEGLTDKNHKASLKERYKIMCQYYGSLPTIIRHLGFALRQLKRKLKK